MKVRGLILEQKQAVTEQIDVVAASMYLSEVRDLVSGIREALLELRRAGTEWVEQQSVASAEVKARPEDFNRERFNAALRASSGSQTDAFLFIEVLLARWARLSLLLHPIPTGGLNPSWRVDRGRLLRSLVNLPDKSLLANRDVRDSWMHYDERMDQSVQEGWLGNRQQFVATAEVAGAIRHAVRVIDMESGTIYFRTREGSVDSVLFSAIDAALDQVASGLESVGERLAGLPLRQRGSATEA